MINKGIKRIGVLFDNCAETGLAGFAAQVERRTRDALRKENEM